MEEKQESISEKVERIARKEGCNNSCITTLIKDEETSASLESFLVNDAKFWLESSRIKDKESHYEALKVYLQLIEEVRGETAEKDKDPAIKL